MCSALIESVYDYVDHFKSLLASGQVAKTHVLAEGVRALVTLSQGRRIRWQSFPTLTHIGQGVANASRVCLDLVRGQYSVDGETSSIDLGRIGLPLPSAHTVEEWLPPPNFDFGADKSSVVAYLLLARNIPEVAKIVHKYVNREWPIQSAERTHTHACSSDDAMLLGVVVRIPARLRLDAGTARWHP